MNYQIIESGSHGNALFLDDCKVLIDIGVSFKKIKPYIMKTRIILTSHVHADHYRYSTIKKCLEVNPQIVVACCQEVYNKLASDGLNQTWLKKRVKVIPIDHKIDWLGYTISPVNLYHVNSDNSPCENYGWRIYKDGYKIIYCVDTHTLENIEAKGYNAYFLESNYSQEKIKQNVIDGELESTLFNRILQSHLSKEQCMNWYTLNRGDNSRLIEIHQSSSNY